MIPGSFDIYVFVAATKIGVNAGKQVRKTYQKDTIKNHDREKSDLIQRNANLIRKKTQIIPNLELKTRAICAKRSPRRKQYLLFLEIYILVPYLDSKGIPQCGV